MNPFEMVVVIVGMALVAGIIKHFIDISRQSHKGSDDNLAKMLQRQQLMEKRIQVLEAIVSSDSYDLNERFRDMEGGK